MGAKTPEQVKKPIKSRPTTVKCDICERKFVSVQAMKSHHKFLHTKSNPSVVIKKQENATPDKKKIVPLHMLKRVNPPESKQVSETEVSATSPALEAKSTSVPSKPAFECPVCAERFAVYFTAFRHIQKKHCVDDQGEKVAPNSPHLVKPIRIETCASCNQQIRSTIPHDCPKLQAYKEQYLCQGCDQTFNGLLLFQHHVKGLHADGAQNYFFPNRNEFESWKKELQEQIHIEFIRLNRQKAKETYHCSHHTVNISTTARLCPSTITIREYTKGIHVCYFQEHSGHTVEDVPLTNQYSISLYTRETDESKLEAEDDNDLYREFKNVVKSVIEDAAKVDPTTLKDLLGRAFEMSSVLKKHHGEDRKPLTSKCLSDDQISMSLDNLNPKPNKRKQSLETKKVVVKKVKIAPTAVENGVTTRHSKNNIVVNKPLSFTRSGLKKNDESTAEETKETPQKEIVETRQKSVQKKAKEQQIKGVLKKAEESKPEESEVEKEVPAPIVRSLLQSPSSFNDSYKHFVDQNFKSVTETSTPKSKPNTKKKEVVKTKMGQFKAKPASPKDLSPKLTKEKEKEVIKDIITTPKAFKAIPDIKYVVKEQENDCNILILKI